MGWAKYYEDDLGIMYERWDARRVQIQKSEFDVESSDPDVFFNRKKEEEI